MGGGMGGMGGAMAGAGAAAAADDDGACCPMHAAGHANAHCYIACACCPALPWLMACLLCCSAPAVVGGPAACPALAHGVPALRAPCGLQTCRTW